LKNPATWVNGFAHSGTGVMKIAMIVSEHFEVRVRSWLSVSTIKLSTVE